MTNDFILTEDEKRQVIAAREQREMNRAGLYGPRILNDPARIALTRQLDELNERSRAAGYGAIPNNTPQALLRAVKQIQEHCYSKLRNAHGDIAPFPIPSRVALEIAELLLAPGD